MTKLQYNNKKEKLQLNIILKSEFLMRNEWHTCVLQRQLSVSIASCGIKIYITLKNVSYILSVQESILSALVMSGYRTRLETKVPRVQTRLRWLTFF